MRSLKDVLKKTPGRINDLQISEIIFAINSHVSQDGTGSNNDRFLGRSVRSGLPNSVTPSLNPETLIHKRIMNHEKKIKNKLKTNKLIYSTGDHVRIQNIRTKDWELLGKAEIQRVADDGSILPYKIQTDLGYPTTRHRHFIRPLVAKTTPAAQECTSDPGIPHNSEETSEQNLPQNADSREQVVATQARPRQSIKRPVRLVL